MAGVWLFLANTLSSGGISLSFSCASLVFVVPPSFMIFTARQAWNLRNIEKDEEAEETSDLESKGDSDPERDPS